MLVRIEARPGREADVENFLEGALSMVNEESKTLTRFGLSTFGVFDAFPDVVGREAHLSGGVTRAPQHDAALFAGLPGIQRIGVLASKPPE